MNEDIERELDYQDGDDARDQLQKAISKQQEENINKLALHLSQELDISVIKVAEALESLIDKGLIEMGV